MANNAQLCALLRDLVADFGFLNEITLAHLASLDPARMVLARFTQAREVIPAGRAAERIAYCERLYRWTLRDVGLLATDPAFGGPAVRPPAPQSDRGRVYGPPRPIAGLPARHSRRPIRQPDDSFDPFED